MYSGLKLITTWAIMWDNVHSKKINLGQNDFE